MEHHHRGSDLYPGLPTEAGQNRVEELEVCFMPDKDEVDARPYRLRFADFELKVPN